MRVLGKNKIQHTGPEGNLKAEQDGGIVAMVIIIVVAERLIVMTKRLAFCCSHPSPKSRIQHEHSCTFYCPVSGFRFCTRKG